MSSLISLLVFTLFFCFSLSEVLLGVLQLTGNVGCSYTAPITINSQDFQVIVDTGSSNLAVASQDCSDCQGISPLYIGDMTSVTVTGSEDNINVTAIVAKEVPVTFAGLTMNMDFLAITTQNNLLTCDNANQGIIGFAYSPVSLGALPVFMDLLVEGGAPDGFAIQLCVPDVGSDETTGNMWIGGYESTFVSGPMMYAKIVEQDFYKVQVPSFSFNGEPISFSSDLSTASVVISTSAMNIVFDTEDNYNALVAALRVSDIITWGVLVTQKARDAFWFEGAPLPSSSSINLNSNLTIELIGVNNDVISLVIPTANFITRSSTSPTDIVFQGFSYNETPGPMIIGGTLLVGYVVFFDRGVNSRIGFGVGINCENTPTVAGIDMFAGPGPSPNPTPTTTSTPSPSPSSSSSLVTNISLISLFVSFLFYMIL